MVVAGKSLSSWAVMASCPFAELVLSFLMAINHASRELSATNALGGFGSKSR